MGRKLRKMIMKGVGKQDIHFGFETHMSIELVNIGHIYIYVYIYMYIYIYRCIYIWYINLWSSMCTYMLLSIADHAFWPSLSEATTRWCRQGLVGTGVWWREHSILPLCWEVKKPRFPVILGYFKHLAMKLWENCFYLLGILNQRHVWLCWVAGSTTL